MINLKNISKILLILIFIQLSLGLIFATNCLTNVGNVSIIQGFDPDPQHPEEYIILLNTQILNNQDLNFLKVNSNNPDCANKKMILDINNATTINLTGNKVNQYISGIDEIRLYSDLNIVVDNADQLGTTTIDFNVPEVKVMQGNRKIYLSDNDKRILGNNSLKLEFINLKILDDVNLAVSIIGDSLPVSDIYANNIAGTNTWLKATTIENQGTLVIDLVGGDGRIGRSTVSGSSSNRVGGAGGYTKININNLRNSYNSVMRANLKSGNGGTGGQYLGNSHYGDFMGGSGGEGGDVFSTILIINNNGQIDLNFSAGNGGTGGRFHNYGSYAGNGGIGGDISDLNISKFINTDSFKFYSIGGKVGNKGIGPENPHGNNRKAGDVGSINIDYLYNTSPNFEIKTELNESDIDNLSSVNCGCFDDCDSATDPTIGDINIKYLASGSFLPKKLEIIKHVPVNETNINIKGCHVESVGNSEISYIADNLILSLANLATIQNDFDSGAYHIGSIFPEEIECPVCDGLELDNMTLRTDTIYTIYTDVINDGNIVDLNIYYVNPDGNLFKPPNHANNQDYVVYSLIPGGTISPINSTKFPDNNIKEYKISKEILHYNPENFNLTNIPSEKGYTKDEVRLFCQGQRYLLRFKFGSNNSPIKEIYFTPIFDID